MFFFFCKNGSAKLRDPRYHVVSMMPYKTWKVHLDHVPIHEAQRRANHVRIRDHDYAFICSALHPFVSASSVIERSYNTNSRFMNTQNKLQKTHSNTIT